MIEYLQSSLLWALGTLLSLEALVENNNYTVTLDFDKTQETEICALKPFGPLDISEGAAVVIHHRSEGTGGCQSKIQNIPYIILQTGCFNLRSQVLNSQRHN